MKNEVELKLDWATYKAAKYACENYHYAGVIPAGKLIKVGVWENGKYIGCIIYGKGANFNIHKPYNLKVNEVCELVRVALKNHIHPVSKMLALSIKFVKRCCPDLKLIVSYADTNQNHHGGIYQATNWIYTGKSSSKKACIYKGKEVHTRSVWDWEKKSDPRVKQVIHVMKKGKHRYVYPLCKSMYYLKEKGLPYPKRVEHESNATDNHSVERGAIPTSTHHLEVSNV